MNAEDLNLTNEEKLLWSLIQSYRKVIDASRFGLTHDEWEEVAHSFNYERPINTFRKNRIQMRKMWSNMIKK